MDACLLSSKKQDYMTPPDFVELVRAVGHISFDPFTGPRNPVGADYFCALPDGDGYKAAWAQLLAQVGGIFFTNPEYGDNLKPFVDKLLGEVRTGAEGVTLTPSRTDTGWWQDMAEGASAGLFWRGRLTFWDQETNAPALTWSKKKQKWEVMPSPFPVFVGYFGPNKDRFYAAFKGKGRFL